MSSSKKDPVAIAREILEGKGKKVVDEGLKKALKAALEDKQEEFDYEGKTYNVSEFNDIEEAKVEDITGKLGGEGVPAPDTKEAEKVGKKAKDNKTKPSKASDSDAKETEKIKGQAQKESVTLDVDEAIGSIEESDDMVALFTGEEELTEDFKTKARTIFEVAIRARVKNIAGNLENQANEKISEIVEANKAELTESLDDYLSYVVEEWVKENQVALDRGIKSDISESFMMGLKNLFEAHYIDMPDEKFDVVRSLEDSVTNLQGKVNEEIQRNVELKKELSNASVSETFTEVAEGLEYGSVQQFREKLELLKESYFGRKTASSTSVLNEVDTEIEDTSDEASYKTPEMARYSSYMTREARHNNF